MRKTIICLLAPLLLAVCGCGHGGRKAPVRPRHHFTELCRVATTPVKNQGHSDLCWAYAMLATIESEHIMRGDSVNLSVDYVARQLLRHLTLRCYLSKGKADISMRGMAPMLVRLIDDSGVEPFDTYCHLNEPVNYHVLARKLQQKARAAQSLMALCEQTDELLDAEIGLLPNIIAMGGAQYTATEFAHSVCSPGEYIGLTSFTHHPFGRTFALEVPDNRTEETFLNIPIDSLMGVIRTALLLGHPVCWEGDISEPGFNWAEGVATLADESHPCSQEQRQLAFETFRTTDDHVMELCGIARDTEGREYFIAKNSWGKDNAFRGYMYLSAGYVRMKTIAIMVARHSAWTSFEKIPH